MKCALVKLNYTSQKIYGECIIKSDQNSDFMGEWGGEEDRKEVEEECLTERGEAATLFNLLRGKNFQ